MESAFNSEPLWSREQFILRPVEELVELRDLALEIAVENQKFDGAVTSAPDGLLPPRSQYGSTKANLLIDLMQAILSTIRKILLDDSRSNSILVTFFAACRRASIDPMTCVNAALCLWYRSAIPLVLRDPQHGLPPDSEVEYEDGVAILRWNRDYASEQQHVANLGLVAMVLSLDLWSKPPKSSSLGVATLVSNAAVSTIYAIQIIIGTGKFEPGYLLASISAISPDAALRLFVRATLNVARVGYDKFDAAPGSEFGASQTEIKLSKNARFLLSKIGRDDWSVAPVWHPCRRVPGSQWNKFMRNTNRAFFGDNNRKKANIAYQLPSSVLSLSEPWQLYYAELRSRFDIAKKPRNQFSSEDLREQHIQLSQATGNIYRHKVHTEQTSQETRDVDQEYLFNLPMIKKPITDAKGNATAPFLTTVARALRFEVEPDETEMDFFMMTFSESRSSN